MSHGNGQASAVVAISCLSGHSSYYSVTGLLPAASMMSNFSIEGNTSNNRGPDVGNSNAMGHAGKGVGDRRSRTSTVGRDEAGPSRNEAGSSREGSQKQAGNQRPCVCVWRAYVDSKRNRHLGRVGMPRGCMPLSNSGRVPGLPPNFSPLKVKLYKDNPLNRRLGRVGLPVGTAICRLDRLKLHNRVSTTAIEGTSSKAKVYRDSPQNRRLGRVGKPKPTAGSDRKKVYQNNPLNRRLGRVGLQVGTAVCSVYQALQNPFYRSPSGTKVYTDTPLNRRLNRVGLPVGGEGQHHRPNQLDTPAVSQPSFMSAASNSSYGGWTPGESRMDMSSTAGSDVEMRSVVSGGKKINSSAQTKLTKEILRHLQDAIDEELCDSNNKRIKDAIEDAATELAFDLRHSINESIKWHAENITSQVKPSTAKKFLEKDGIDIIPFSQINVQKKIGQGAFGDVHFAKWKKDPVACKILRFNQLSARRLEEFLSEVRILGKVRHPNIVKLIGACVGPPTFCIVMEYLPVSLYETLYTDKKTSLNQRQKHSVLLQMALGVAYLHKIKVAHCNLKPHNVLLQFEKDEVIAKLTDFGLSKFKRFSETSLTVNKPIFVACTPRYAAPEILRGDMLETVEERQMTDMYSFGLVVYEVLCEDEPFAFLDMNQLLRHVGDGDLIPELPPNLIIKEMDHAVRQCLHRNPKARASAVDFVNILTKHAKLYVGQ